MKLESFLRSPLVTINFAGFRAHTLELQNSGWALSAHESISHRTAMRQIQIILSHSGGGLTMVSHVELYDLDFMTRSISLPEMNVVGCSIAGGRSFFMPRVRTLDLDFMKNQFSPVDGTPSYEEVDLCSIDLRKFGVFKKINDVANIFLPEKTINELMDDVLNKQATKQKEIRANKARHQFMQEFNRNPNEDIKVQLIAI